MSSNGVNTSIPARRGIQISRWTIRLLIAFILSMTVMLALSASTAVSR